MKILGPGHSEWVSCESEGEWANVWCCTGYASDYACLRFSVSIQLLCTPLLTCVCAHSCVQLTRALSIHLRKCVLWETDSRHRLKNATKVLCLERSDCDVPLTACGHYVFLSGPKPWMEFLQLRFNRIRGGNFVMMKSRCLSFKKIDVFLYCCIKY